ncbi:MAG: amidophosphoribosyltransferase [Candidatus Omnitrophica bacterium]|nr:amidophosphoribosyltransferase [Candidatus Omnitrophota bacterium]MBU4346831.1 amidophosphoribosyltransferase [Candidatus Omnitrophota bacterium]MBU4472667.1 amidophosphoribosyltransferase [Candidatus Omnitrophota bacterium]MCG2706706.1 amidophosphoribosyltransferase [Candidatus Omnitrophota bacterium]
MSGIFGSVSRDDCSHDLFYGTDYHSHLGTQFAGLALWQDEGLVRKIHDIRGSQFKAKFYEDYQKMKGNKGIGVISAIEEQPICVNSKFGPFAIVTNGFIDNAQDLAKQLYKRGQSFSEVTDSRLNLTELVAKIIIQGEDIIDGIEKMFSKIDGSCSLLLLNKDGIYAARDRYGYTPLIVGQRDKDWAVTTETFAFSNLGFKIKKYLQPGEIIFIDEEGIKTKRRGSDTNQICAFLWIYTGFPASSYEGITVELVRERCGRFLAKADNIKKDIVAGIPDSGTTHAIGYAIESKVPFRRPLVKYTPGFDRSYTPPSQETRDLIAKMKLIPIQEIIKGKRIVICDDSIVRGTQLKSFTIQKLKECGVKEVHLRIACPPLMFPCKFNYSTRSIDELAARRAIRVIAGKDVKDLRPYLDERSPKYKKMVEWITKDLGATTLKYQKLNDMVSAIGLPKEKLCLYCWTGRGPR